MIFGELGSMGWVSIQVYGKGEGLSLTCISGPSPSQMCMSGAHNRHDKQYGRPLRSFVAVRIDRKEHEGSGGDMLTL